MSARPLTIVLISVHGLVRGHSLELGRDADTGGQAKYVVELARALCDNSNLLVFARNSRHGNVLVVCNFKDQPERLRIANVVSHGFLQHGGMVDLTSGQFIEPTEESITIPSLSFYWLAHR